jgi:probable HAF family extracellular repeat protein
MSASVSLQYRYLVLVVATLLICCGGSETRIANAAPLINNAAVVRYGGLESHKPLYTVRNLGSLGGTSCCLVVTVNVRGWVNGTSNLPGDKNFHPFLWVDGVMTDLGTLGGPNASVGGMNDRGDVTVGGSDTGMLDPNGEDFCVFGTHQICRSFVWRNGKRMLIPTLGGNNGDVNGINNDGLVLAVAETTVHDSTCVAPQKFRYEAFSWDPDTNAIYRLHPLKGDLASEAFAMNDRGEFGGYSGACGNGEADPYTMNHAVVWQHGIAIRLKTLGGTVANTVFGINNHGQTAGWSALRGDTTAHAVLWQNDTPIDLGALPGDHFSVAGGINDAGQIVLQSCKDLSAWLHNKCRAAVWQNGVMTDLNTLIQPGSPLLLVGANSINNRGDIAGTALDRKTGSFVPFLATPCSESGGSADGCRE